MSESNEENVERDLRGILILLFESCERTRIFGSNFLNNYENVIIKD